MALSTIQLNQLPQGIVKDPAASALSGGVRDINFNNHTAPNMADPVVDTDGMNLQTANLKYVLRVTSVDGNFVVFDGTEGQVQDSGLSPSDFIPSASGTIGRTVTWVTTTEVGDSSVVTANTVQTSVTTLDEAELITGGANKTVKNIGEISGKASANSKIITAAGDATAPTDLMNQQTCDARYVQEGTVTPTGNLTMGNGAGVIQTTPLIFTIAGGAVTGAGDTTAPTGLLNTQTADARYAPIDDTLTESGTKTISLGVAGTTPIIDNLVIRDINIVYDQANQQFALDMSTYAGDPGSQISVTIMKLEADIYDPVVIRRYGDLRGPAEMQPDLQTLQYFVENPTLSTPSATYLTPLGATRRFADISSQNGNSWELKFSIMGGSNPPLQLVKITANQRYDNGGDVILQVEYEYYSLR